MKRKIVVSLLGVLGGILFLPTSGLCIMSCSMHTLPQGQLDCEFTSPQNTYTVAIFRERPLLSSDNIRGEVVINESGARRNLYWARDTYEQPAGCDVSWESEHFVVINGHRLDVRRDHYDFRG